MNSYKVIKNLKLICEFLLFMQLMSSVCLAADNQLREKCLNKFYSLGMISAQKVSQYNLTHSEKLPISETDVFQVLKTLDQNFELVEKYKTLTYKDSPIEVLYKEEKFYVKCEVILKYSDLYLVGLVLHEIARKIDSTNGTLFEGDFYGISKKIIGDNEYVSYTDIQIRIQERMFYGQENFIDYNIENECTLNVLSNKNKNFDLIFKIVEFKNLKNDFFILIEDNSSKQKYKLKGNILSNLLKKQSYLFKLIVKDKKEQSVRIEKIDIKKYTNDYNLNQNAFISCESKLF